MSNWFYAAGGKQTGPVSSSEIQRMIRSGELNPERDLGWREGMRDWTPLGQIPELTQSADLQPSSDPTNPYGAPQTTWLAAEAAPAAGCAPEITPGSDPLDASACVSRAWELVKLHFGTIILTGLIYLGVSMIVEIPFGILEAVFSTKADFSNIESFQSVSMQTRTPVGLTIAHQLISQILSLFLSLGATRIGLNLVSGKAVAPGMIFGEGKKLLRAIGASILFGLMVFLGLILLFVPGIYLALRYGQFLNAIVDRDLGVMESFEYSSRLTTGNRGNLLLLGLLMIVVTIAGLLVCGVGLIVAFPITWLSSFIAYRWLQYGRTAALGGQAIP